ncbi:hypothetical protein ACVWXN_008543 [Bradyrhizobium sp. i1.4.4]
MRWFLFNVIGTSIGLGMLLITVFDNWMRGYSIFWWVMLALLTMLSILINALMLVGADQAVQRNSYTRGRSGELARPKNVRFSKVAAPGPTRKSRSYR